EVASEPAQGHRLFGFLDAFGDGAEPECVGEVDDELAERRLGRTRGETVDEALVDLQHANGEMAEVVERGVAGAEVVDRELDTQVPELLEAARRGGGVFD